MLPECNKEVIQVSRYKRIMDMAQANNIPQQDNYFLYQDILEVCYYAWLSGFQHVWYR